MKKIHLGTLVAVSVAAAISANAQADSLQEAITGGTFSGGLRNTLELSTNTNASGAGALNNAHVFGSALTLDYLTGSYYGFKVGVGTETGYDWGIQDDDTLTTAGGENDHRATVNTTNLYRAFLQYDFNKDLTNTMIRVGRQKIVSPLVMNSGMYPMQDSFDAVVIENKDLPQTALRAMYITKWNMRYGDDNTGSITQTDKDYDSPLVSLYFDNKSVKGLDIEGQWLRNHNDENAGDPPTAVTAKNYDTTFLALTYQVPDSKWIVGAKTLSADFKDSDDTGYWGAMVKNTFGGVGVQLAYTSVDDAANFPGSLGHAPMFRAYNPGVTDEYVAGLDATSVAVDYGFGLPGFKSTVGLTSWKQSATGATNSGGIDLDGGYEASLRIDYKAQTIKGLSTLMQLSYIDYDQDVSASNMTVLRTSVNYQF